MAKLSYFEKRAANNVWNSYNDTEKYQKELIEIYQVANKEVLEEIYTLGRRIETGGKLSRSEFYRGNHLKRISSAYTKILKSLGSNVEDKGQRVVLEAGKDVYTAVGKSLGIPINYNKSGVKRLMQDPWHGATFSERIWKNQSKLHEALMDTVKDGIHKGRSTTEVAIQLNNKMNTGLNNAARLVRTETMHHLNDAGLQAMLDSGVTQVKEIVTLDERTSDECAPHHGLIHDIDKAPTLPRHPNCRCVLVPYVDVDKMARQLDEEESRILAKLHVEKMSKVEPEVTRDLQSVADTINGKLEGLEHRLKKAERLKEKIIDDSRDLRITLQEADSRINDVLRYTMVSNEDSYTDNYFKVIDKLSKLGYNEVRVKNTFKEGVPYKGLNTLVKKEENIFELQYHTSKSFEVKEGILHDLYEEQRVLDLSTQSGRDAFDKLTDVMIRESSMIPNPKNVERIK